MYKIRDIEEYDYCVSRGFEPLIDTAHFEMDIKLRDEIQKELFGHCVFGRGDIPVANQRFYEWIWKNKAHYCEECLRPLPQYSSVYCSHILSRGANPEMAYDGRNINILCGHCHEQWENGVREKMRIFEKNKMTIEILQIEYSQLKHSK